MALHIEQLAKIVAKETGQPIGKTEETLWAAFDALANIVAAEDGAFSVPNFGTFDSRMHAASKRRSLQTGEIVVYPARRRARFRATGTFADMVRSTDTGRSIRRPDHQPKR